MLLASTTNGQMILVVRIHLSALTEILGTDRHTLDVRLDLRGVAIGAAYWPQCTIHIVIKRFCFGWVQAGVFAVLGPACILGAKMIYNEKVFAMVFALVDNFKLPIMLMGKNYTQIRCYNQCGNEAEN